MTNPITWPDVAAVAPELSSGVAVDAQDAILAFANEAFDVGLFAPAQIRLARINLAAHIATLQKRRGAPGPVSAQSMGGVAESYAIVPGRRWFGTGYADVLNLLLDSSLARLPTVI